MLHLSPLHNLEVRDDVLVLAREQQGCWDWGIRFEQLQDTNPALVANPNGKWEADCCSLEEFLRFFALTNRPCEPPCLSQAGYDQDRLEGAWEEHRIEWRSIQHAIWTNGEAVLDESTGNLGARDLDALRRAAASLAIDPEELEDVQLA